MKKLPSFTEVQKTIVVLLSKSRTHQFHFDQFMTEVDYALEIDHHPKARLNMHSSGHSGSQNVAIEDNRVLVFTTNGALVRVFDLCDPGSLNCLISYYDVNSNDPINSCNFNLLNKIGLGDLIY